jgi:formylglycine-generating enzyme required for sulfatase activity
MAPVAGLVALLAIHLALHAAPAGPTAMMTKGGAEMVLIPAGSFEMGSDRGQADEAPVHRVCVDAFLMDRCEVTQAQYAEHVLGNPSHFKGPTLPIEQVSWADAALYCNARSKAEGLEPCYDEDSAECNLEANGYRLPTEAEWEYACRAGATTDYSFGSSAAKLKDHAWYTANSGKQTHPVGQKTPNAWGLHDMHGNVAEWCNDMYDARYYEASPDRNPPGPADSDKYVLRGGAFNSKPDECRSSFRLGDDPGFQDPCFRGDHIGFRCVRRHPEPPRQSRRRTSPAPNLQRRQTDGH